MNQEPKTPLYAVYGTLRKGFHNHYILDNEHCNLLGTFRTEPAYKMITLGGFPGVILGGNQSITIEVYAVSSKERERRLDWLEGYPKFYQKTKIQTPYGEAEMYILSEEQYGHHRVIASGDWAEHIGDLKKA